MRIARFAFTAVSAFAVAAARCDTEPQKWITDNWMIKEYNRATYLDPSTFEPISVSVSDDGTFDNNDVIAMIASGIPTETIDALENALKAQLMVENLANVIYKNAVLNLSYDDTSRKLKWKSMSDKGSVTEQEKIIAPNITLKQYPSDTPLMHCYKLYDEARQDLPHIERFFGPMFYEYSPDGTSLELRTTEIAGQGEGVNIASIHGWSTASPGTRYTLGDIMTNSIYSTERSHKIMVRSPGVQGGPPTLNYVDIGGLALGDAKVNTDELSVTTNGTDRVGIVAIEGFASNEGSAENPALPVAIGKDEKMTFRKVSDLFNAGVFVVSTDGKVALKGNGGDNGKILTIKGEDNQQTLEASEFDNASITLTDSKYQVAHFASPVSPAAGVDFADMMTNQHVTTSGYKIMIRGGGENPSIYYADFGKFQNIINSAEAFPSDDSSVTTNANLGASVDGVMSLYGYSTAVQDAQGDENGAPHLPMVTANGEGKLEWANALSFLSSRAFKFGEDGKIILNGMGDEEEGSINVVTIDPSETGSVVTKKSFDTDVFEVNATKGVTIKNIRGTDANNLYDLLTNPNSQNRAAYAAVGRVNEEGNITPTVIPLGNAICPPIPGAMQSGAWLATRTENGLGWINFNPAADNICSNLWAALYYDLHDNAPAFDGNAQRISFIPDKFIDGCSLANFDHELPSEDLPEYKRYLGLYQWEDPEEDVRDLALCLTNNDVYAEGLKVLVRDEYSDDLLGRPVLRYLDIGHLVQDKEKQGDIVDWKSTSTNQDGRVEMYGFHELTDLDNGRFPVKNGNAITWVSTNEFAGANVDYDEHSVYTNGQGKVEIFGFKDVAQDGTLPVKVGNYIGWVSTNNFVSTLERKLPFSFYDGKWHGCRAILGRSLYSLGTGGSGTATDVITPGETRNGDYYVHITHSTHTATIDTSNTANNDTSTTLWIGRLEGLKQTDGIYSVPTIPLYE